MLLTPSLHHPLINPRPRPLQSFTKPHRHRFHYPSCSLRDLFSSIIISPDLIAPAIGFATGTALFLSSHRTRSISNADVTPTDSSLVLYATPSPFNHSVILRCPSLSVDSDLLPSEGVDVNITLNNVNANGRGCGVEYQRVCVGTEDGGVISLDWPEELDVGKEYGRDTTVIIVPGTVEGSMGQEVKGLVEEVRGNGCFPIVVNPRGCGGSPLTTARLFTAADSNDICTAIQFVNNYRPWTTLMGVGWGYGANMLTKYLAEVGVGTPLTAAVCIDNPFDLEEATRSFTNHTVFSQKLRSGLIDILRANKELFQGKSKGFDVDKALAAKSFRDFDESISMISYGFSDIDEFYSKTSTSQSVSSVKIPVLFVQSGDSMGPSLSLLRSSIAENPFTSLLLCSSLPSITDESERSVIHRCQHVVIEWLSAVEFALLKGRHPLIKDVKTPINPSKSRSIEGITSESSTTGRKAHGSYKPSQSYHGLKNINGDALMKLSQSNSVNGYLNYPLASAKGGAVKDKFNRQSKLGSEYRGVSREEDIGTKQYGKGEVSHESYKVVAKEGDAPIDGEESQVIQTASVVMRMLDVTMPGALADEQKKKVLAAMERGETLMKALEGAVPEEVRGKLTGAATEILQTHRTKLNLDGLKGIGWIPKVTSEVKSRIQEKVKGVPAQENGHETDKLDQRTAGAGNNGMPQDEPALIGYSSTQESNVSSQEKAVQVFESIEAGTEEERNRHDTKFESSSTDGEVGSDEEYKANLRNGLATKPLVSDQIVNDANDIPRNDGKQIDSVDEQNIPASSPDEVGLSISSTNEQLVEKEANIQKNDEKSNQEAMDQDLQSSSTRLEESTGDQKPPSLSVSQALDAFTGFDDSTQMAVNSVFGVIENMIDQYEKANNQGTDEESNKKDQESVNASHELPRISEDKSEKLLNGKSRPSLESDVIHTVDKKETSVLEDDSGSHKKTDENGEGKQESKLRRSLSSSTKQSISRSQEKIPLEVAVDPLWESLYGTYFPRYLSVQLPVKGSRELDSTTDLVLDPEEGQWKMLNQSGNTKTAVDESEENQRLSNFLSRQGDEERVVEPSYVILDSEYSGFEHHFNEECDSVDCNLSEEDALIEKLVCLIRITLLDSLKIEIGRRSGILDLRELGSDLLYDLEDFSNTVSQAVILGTEWNLNISSNRHEATSLKLGTVDGENVLRIISSAMMEATHVREVLSVGVVAGTCFTCLKKYFDVAVQRDGSRGKPISEPKSMKDKLNAQKVDLNIEGACAGSDNLREDNPKTGTENLNTDGVMVGAVTAAFGASVLFAGHQQGKNNEPEISGTPSGSYSEKNFAQMEQEAMQQTNQHGLVGSLAEKAMSVAAPVVPTKGDGGVDQDRLVAILAELGQRGGVLRLVGKLALLWGGVRGAMSLTDKLISFFHIAERPLFQRILGFAGMVLVLWSPVVIPLLPTLVQSWTTKTSNGIAHSACIMGLYVAIMFLVMLWGKRIRGYINPIEQYGLDFRSASRIREFTMGLVGGVSVVLCIHCANALLGFACLSWPPSLIPSSADATMLLKAFASVTRQAGGGIVQGIGVAIVEELLFRSWLIEEVAVDLGYYRAIMLSAIVFSLAQRSVPSIPAYLLLSLALSGIKQRTNNKLSATVGARAGIMSANFIFRTAGFLTYQSRTPFWISSIHLWHPFDGAVGLGFCALMAILFYPQSRVEEQRKRS